VNLIRTTTTILLITLMGCAWAKDMRKDVYGEESYDVPEENYFAYKDKRKNLKPATVMDRQIKMTGQPVDLSGVKGKFERTTKKDFEELAQRNDNSLWKDDGQTNYLFSSNINRVPGDLVTVDADSALHAQMKTEFAKALSSDELETGVFVNGLGKVSNVPATTTASAVDKTKEGEAGADVAKEEKKPEEKTEEEKNRAIASTAGGLDQAEPKVSYTAEIVDVYPNGNVLLRGVKRFNYNGRQRTVEVTSIAKATDISEAGNIPSSKFYEYRTEMH